MGKKLEREYLQLKCLLGELKAQKFFNILNWFGQRYGWSNLVLFFWAIEMCIRLI